jgi:phage terminase large subunit
LCDTIERLGLNAFYIIQEKAIKGVNGTEFFFEGLKANITKIKSIEGIDICWCEEAEAISEMSWDVLTPTIRKKGSEIWVSFNPHDEMDNTYQRFVAPYLNKLIQLGQYEDDSIIVTKVNYWDNPWFAGSALEDEMLKMKVNNYRKYLWVYEGECNSDYADSIIRPEWVEAAIDSHKKLNFEGLGVKVLGFDPADEGDDEKAIAIRRGSVVEYLDHWKEGDLDDAIKKAIKCAESNNVDVFVYDSVGIGAGVKLALKRDKTGQDIPCEGFDGGAGVRDPDRKYEDDKLNKNSFRNLRAQFWWSLRDRFEKTYLAVDKQHYIDPDELISISSSIKDLSQLKSELCRVKRKRGVNSLIQLESKSEMTGASPNMADALVMCFANKPIRKHWGKLEYQRVSVA